MTVYTPSLSTNSYFMLSLLLASTHSAETVRHSYTELTADAKITIRARTYAEQTAA